MEHGTQITQIIARVASKRVPLCPKRSGTNIKREVKKMRVYKKDLLLGVPIMLAHEYDDQLHAWCSYCAKYHHHGVESNNQVVLAHCVNPYSPYIKTNYLLKKKDDLDDEFVNRDFIQSDYIDFTRLEE